MALRRFLARNPRHAVPFLQAPEALRGRHLGERRRWRFGEAA
jgi:hypothetical protein